MWLIALSFLACFATVRVIGLPPDAALYAGLAKKVLMSGESWLLRGTSEFFPRFFEHPPYFFQWGAWLMGHLGFSDATAKMMGAIPSFLSLLLLSIFLYRKWGWGVAAWTLLIVATTGHYTKYAATALLEAPLSFFTLISAIATFYFLTVQKNYLRLFAMFALYLGVAGACAAKGVVGLGCLGGAILSYLVFIFYSNRSLMEVFRAMFLGVFLFTAAFLPFMIWMLQSFKSPEIMEWVIGYFNDQVLRSATTNRGEESFAEGANYLYFLGVIVRNLWPWWWTVPAGALLAFRKKYVEELPEDFRLFVIIAFSFFLSFAIPLSMVTYKLPHYLHPTYLVLAPLGGWFMSLMWKKFRKKYQFSKFIPLAFRWGVIVLIAGFAVVKDGQVTGTANRGQEFFELGHEIFASDMSCELWIPEDQTAPYRLEAYALWYLDGRLWKRIEGSYPSEITVPSNVIYWDPSKDILWQGSDCL